LARLNAVRLARNAGRIPLGVAILSIVVLAYRRKLDALRWCGGLLAMALPLNFAPNLAYLHDFFVLLYVPAIALAIGLLAGRLAERFPDRVARRAILGLLAAFVAVDVIPASTIVGTRPEDTRQDAIARELGQTIGPRDLVIADPSVCSYDPDHFPIRDGNREWPPLPFYAGRICQTVLVARTPEEAIRLTRNPEIRAKRNVFILNCGKGSWQLPEEFTPCRPSSPIARFQLWQDSMARIAAGGRGDLPATLSR
jgi:hypothetical protein